MWYPHENAKTDRKQIYDYRACASYEGDLSQLVAIDMIGAGVSEYVLSSTGSAARIGCGVETAPVDAAIVVS